jgi:hypothetical protein
MTPNTFTLSIEELAYALGVLGGTEIASGYLGALLGERPQLELEGRLLAASHALVARDLLDFNPRTGDKQLSPELADLLRSLIQNEYSLRCNRVTAGEEDGVNFYRAGNAWLEHRLSKAVVAHVTALAGIAMVARQSAMFFGLPIQSSKPLSGASQSVGVIPAALLERFGRPGTQPLLAEITKLFVSAGLPLESASALAADLAAPILRGSMMKVETRTEGLMADRGFLFFKGTRGAWILEIIPQAPPMLRVFVGNSDQLQRSVESLLA